MSELTTEWLDNFVVNCNILNGNIWHKTYCIDDRKKIDAPFMFQFSSKYIKLTIKVFQTKMKYKLQSIYF